MPATTHNLFGKWPTTDRHQNFGCSRHNKNWCCCQQGCQFLHCCCPFLQRDLNNIFLFEGNPWVCLLIVWHMRTCFSISPFLCCCCVLFFAIFLGIGSTYIPPKFLLTSNKASTSHLQDSKTYPRQALAAHSLEGVHFRACFADSWVAESAHSVSRRYYSLIGCSPGVPLKALERLTSCLSGGNLLRVLLVYQTFYQTAFIAWALEACATSKPKVLPLALTWGVFSK